MATELPDEVDCRQLADEFGSVSGSIAAARLARVGGTFRITGSAVVKLEFCRDEHGRAVINGAITAPIEAQCQRCLQWMSLEIGVTVCVVALRSIDDDESEGLDVVAVPDGRLKLAELVEDEILLACPMIPAHDEASCSAPRSGAVGSTEERYKPFAGLADLIDKRN